MSTRFVIIISHVGQAIPHVQFMTSRRFGTRLASVDRNLPIPRFLSPLMVPATGNDENIRTM